MAASVYGLGVRLFVNGAAQFNAQLQMSLGSLTGMSQKIMSSIGDMISSAGRLDDEMFQVLRVGAVDSRVAMDALREELLLVSAGLPLTAQDLSEMSVVLGQAGFTAENTEGKFVGLVEMIGKFALVTRQSNTEAAKSLTSLMTIFGLTADEAEQMASTIVGVASKTKADAGDLTKATVRFGSFAKGLGFTAAESVALASALAEVGEGAERGGTAIQGLLIDMVRNQSVFARFSGMSESQFATLKRSEQLVKILAAINGASSAEQIRLFATLGTTSRRYVAHVINLAKTIGGANSKFRLEEMFATANDLFTQNSELTSQFNTQMQSFGNVWKTFAGVVENIKLTLGTALIPIANVLLRVLTAIMSLFFVLPKPVKIAIAVFGALTAVLIAVAVAALAAKLAVMGFMVATAPFAAAMGVFFFAWLPVALKALAIFAVLAVAAGVLIPNLQAIGDLFREAFADKEVVAAMRRLSDTLGDLSSTLGGIWNWLFGIETISGKGSDKTVESMNKTTTTAQKLAKVLAFVVDMAGALIWMVEKVAGWFKSTLELVGHLATAFTLVSSGEFLSEKGNDLFLKELVDITSYVNKDLSQAIEKLRARIYGSSFLHIAEDLRQFAIPAFEALGSIIMTLLTPLFMVKDAAKSVWAAIAGDKNVSLPVFGLSAGAASRSTAAGGSAQESAEKTTTSAAMKEAVREHRIVVVSQVFLDGRQIWESVEEHGREVSARRFSIPQRTVRGVG